MKHSGTDSMDFAVMVQSLLLGSVLIVSLFTTPEVSAQTVRYVEPMAPTSAIPSVTQTAAPSSRLAGDLPELVWVEDRWCEEIEDFCPISEEYDFGTVATGSSGLYLGLWLLNRSESAPATNLSLQLDAEFLLFPDMYDCTVFDELPPGELCRVRVKFAPSMPGPVTGAITMTSAEVPEAGLPLLGTGGNDRLLYGQFHDWETTPSFFSTRNAIYANSPEFSSEFADDFIVEDPKGWVIRQIGLEFSSTAHEPDVDSFDIFVMSDDDGIPGDVAVCSAPDSKIHFLETPFDESRVELILSSACEIPPGHYWLLVQPHTDDFVTSGFYGWGMQYLTGSEEEPPGEPPIHLNPPVWRNPGNYGGHGCTTWTSIYPPACGFEDWWPWALAYDAIFWLIGEPGTVSNEGGPNEIAQRLTHPSPNPVRETASFTLAVDRGQQVTVEVFDMMGRRLLTLYEGSLAAGATETLRLNASTLSSGVYLIRAVGEDFVDTRRVTVVH